MGQWAKFIFWTLAAFWRLAIASPLNWAVTCVVGFLQWLNSGSQIRGIGCDLMTAVKNPITDPGDWLKMTVVVGSTA